MIQKILHPWFLLFFGVLCIAFSAIFVKLAAINGVSAAFYRVLIAGVALLPVYALKRRFVFQWREALLAMLCGVFFGSDISMWYVSIMKTDATIATLLGNLAPLWTGVLGYFFYRLKPSKYYWIGMAIAINGVAMLLGYHNIIAMKINSGVFLAISASVFYALYILTSSVVRKTFDTMSFMMFTLLGTIATTFIYCLLLHAPFSGFSTQSWMALLGMGLISHLLGWLAINRAMGHIPSTEASIGLLSQSVVTGLFASFLLGERLLLHQIVGGCIVLAGIALVYVKRTKMGEVM